MTAAEEFYSSHIVLCVFNAFLSYTSIALNSLAIYAMKITSSSPKNLKTLLLSLAVSDLGVGLIVQPLYIAIRVMELQPNFGNNPTYKATHYAYIFWSNLLCIASFHGVTALTVDRYLAIHLHLKYQELVTHERVVAVVISIWLISAIGSLARSLDLEETITSISFATVGYSSPSQIPGTCDSRARCCCGDLNLVDQCHWFIGKVVGPGRDDYFD